jgi:hypothetical protein
MRAAAVIGTEGLGAELRRHLALHQRQLADYQAIEERDFAPEGETTEDRLRHLVLRGGIALETFWVNWLDEALSALDES